MSQKFLTFCLIFIIAAAQVSLSSGLFFARIVPDLMLVLVIIWAMRQSFQTFWLWAILAGIVLDVVSLGTIGLNAASFLIVAFGINFVSKRFFVVRRDQAFFWVAILVLGGTVVHYLLTIGLLSFSPGTQTGLFVWHNLAFKMLNNFIALAIVYWPVVNSQKIFPVERERLIVR